jgi:hypothetical protein
MAQAAAGGEVLAGEAAKVAAQGAQHPRVLGADPQTGADPGACWWGHYERRGDGAGRTVAGGYGWHATNLTIGANERSSIPLVVHRPTRLTHHHSSGDRDQKTTCNISRELTIPECGSFGAASYDASRRLRPHRGCSGSGQHETEPHPWARRGDSVDRPGPAPGHRRPPGAAPAPRGGSVPAGLPPSELNSTTDSWEPLTPTTATGVPSAAPRSYSRLRARQGIPDAGQPCGATAAWVLARLPAGARH